MREKAAVAGWLRVLGKDRKVGKQAVRAAVEEAQELNH
jgi:hypothetical protein